MKTQLLISVLLLCTQLYSAPEKTINLKPKVKHAMALRSHSKTLEDFEKKQDAAQSKKVESKNTKKQEDHDKDAWKDYFSSSSDDENSVFMTGQDVEQFWHTIERVKQEIDAELRARQKTYNRK